VWVDWTFLIVLRGAHLCLSNANALDPMTARPTEKNDFPHEKMSPKIFCPTAPRFVFAKAMTDVSQKVENPRVRLRFENRHPKVCRQTVDAVRNDTAPVKVAIGETLLAIENSRKHSQRACVPQDLRLRLID
jgi:hypothetical protein